MLKKNTKRTSYELTMFLLEILMKNKYKVKIMFISIVLLINKNTWYCPLLFFHDSNCSKIISIINKRNRMITFCVIKEVTVYLLLSPHSNYLITQEKPFMGWKKWFIRIGSNEKFSRLPCLNSNLLNLRGVVLFTILRKVQQISIIFEIQIKTFQKLAHFFFAEVR